MAGGFDKVDLKEALEKQMEKAREQNRLPARGAFITEEFVGNLFTVKNIKEQLREDVDTRTFSDYDRRQLAQSIKDKGKKLYAILILLDESPRICGLIKATPQVNDNFLFETSRTGFASLPCPLEKLKGIKYLADIADAFYQKQWVFPPSLLADETQDFHKQHFLFPFKSIPKRLGEGAFGEVYAVDLPRGYLEPLTNETGESPKNTPIAYKKIRRGGLDDKRWGKVKREVQVLRARPHSNITPLLGSFLAGLDDTQHSNSGAECLYILSPPAVMDMRTWLKNPPEGVKTCDEDDLRRHIYSDAMLGLISGVTWIHREINGRVGYHRDIKPSNLLLFYEAGSKQVWKICDFGSSNLKLADDTATTNPTATKYWAPPEYFTDRDATDGELHGRAHDVFSIGCVFLCLATILRWRWSSEGLDKFKSQRMAIEDSIKDADDSTEVHAFHNSMTAVYKWVEFLQENRLRDQDREVLALIDEMLQPRDKRIFSWEVEVDLFIILDKARPPEEVTKRLSKVIQQSRGLSVLTRHNAYARAKKKAALEDEKDRKRSPEFFRILEDSRWHEYSPQSTTDGSRHAAPVHKPLSNLSSPQIDEDLCGGQDLYLQISNGFAKSDIVVLYGVAGVGKSRIADVYALQFVDPEDTSLKRHTFRVNARSVTDLTKSYHAIAELINKPLTGTKRNKKASFEARAEDIKPWLEDENNGRWFMVVDGLDSHWNAKEIRRLLPLPKQGYDEMLITTRNRAVVEDLDLYHRDACIEVDPPGLEDSLRLFSHYIDKSLFKQKLQNVEKKVQTQADPHTEKLLKTLWSPTLIKAAVKDMNKKHTPVAQMNDLFKENGFSQVEGFFPNYLEYLLQPLMTESLSNPESWPREVHLLFLLAFFDSNGVDYNILTIGYKGERDVLQRLLARLQDCSLIKRDDKDDSTVYIINGNIQLALLEWVKNATGESGGQEGLLLRYNKALSMTYRYYMSKRTTERTINTSLKTHEEKLPLMPHFECFLAFIQSNPQHLDFVLDDAAVRAITYFSHALLDQDRHTEALNVIEYAQKHFKIDYRQDDALDPSRPKRTRILFWLGRQLVKAYMSRPEDHQSSGYWDKAEALIKSLKKEAGQINDQELKWAGYTVLQWELVLDLVRVLWKSKRCAEARKMLDSISKTTGMLTESAGRVVEPTREERIAEWLETREGESLDAKGKRLSRLRKLFIQVTREDGLLNIAEGMKLADDQGSKHATRSWDAAKEAFTLAEKAVIQWFPAERELLSEIRVEIAVADTKIGRQDLVRGAIRVLHDRVAKVRNTYGDCRRTWNMERKLNAARLRCDRHQIEVATGRSRELLRLYEQSLGREKLATKKCALQLREGLLKLGKLEEALALRDDYPSLPPIPSHVGYSWSSKCMLLALSVCIVGGLYYQFL